MPVADSKVHPSTVGSERYDACQKKVRKKWYWARDIDFNVVPPLDKWVKVIDTSSTECRYDRPHLDPKCNGCPRFGEGIPYDQEVRKEKP